MHSELRTVSRSGGSVSGAAYWILVSALTAVAVILSWYLYQRPLWTIDTVVWLSLLVTALGALLVLSMPGVALFGFVGMYGLYLALSHLGAVGSVVVSRRALETQPAWFWSWLYMPELPIAVALSGLGIASFALGAALFWRLGARVAQPQPLDQAGAPGIYWVGFALLLFAACYVPFVVISGALPVLANYFDYRSAIDGLPFYAFTLFALATGMAFTMAVGDRRQRRRAILLFLVPAVIIGLSGSRGGVLWPIVTAVAVCSARGYRPGMKLVGIGAILFFLYIPVVEQVREGGLAQARVEDLSLHWTAPFVTNGVTLRPLVATVQWIEAGESLALGQTYLLPVQRIVGRLMPFVERPAYEAEPVSWEQLHARIPRQGYTVIGEAYYNFGVLGVLLLLGGLGAALARLGDGASAGASLAVSGALLAVLLNNVRNYSVFVPGQTALVLVLWIVGVTVSALSPLVASRLESTRRFVDGAPLQREVSSAHAPQ